MQASSFIDYGVLLGLYDQVKSRFREIENQTNGGKKHSELIALSADLRRISELNREAARQIRDTTRSHRASLMSSQYFPQPEQDL